MVVFRGVFVTCQSKQIGDIICLERRQPASRCTSKSKLFCLCFVGCGGEGVKGGDDDYSSSSSSDSDRVRPRSRDRKPNPDCRELL